MCMVFVLMFCLETCSYAVSAEDIDAEWRQAFLLTIGIPALIIPVNVALRLKGKIF